MKHITGKPFLLATLIAAMSGHALAEERLIVPAETFQPATQPQSSNAEKQLKAAALSGLKMARGKSHSMSVNLGAPSEAELEQLQQGESGYKALKVGIKREIPILPAVADWVWAPVTGGKAGHFLINSDEATRLRAQLRLTADLPEGVEIRIYTPDENGSTQTIHGPFTQADFNRSQQAGTEASDLELWTPSVDGNKIGIEVFAPDATDLDAIKLELPAISHIVYDLQSSQFKNASQVSSYKLSDCSVSIACAPGMWQETAKSVARYIYTNPAGNSFLCSGTLLTDQDTNTQIPYFLTAAHCVEDAATAATMDFFWLYRESSCGADDAEWTQVSGGAELLVGRTELDTTLVRMNQLPPAGITMAGWLVEPFTANAPIAGIHHAMGDMKQFSAGQFSQHIDIERVDGGYIATPNPDGDFTQVIWSTGITLTGSSGSGLWKTIDSQHYLTGTLIGGSSTCAAPQSPDEYSRLSRFYPYASQWLAGTSEPAPLRGILNDQEITPIALTDGVMLSRYMNGVRGSALLTGITDDNVDISNIESQLQNAVITLDIDKNGSLEAERDGLLLIRYLLGLRGNSLTAEIDLAAGPDTTPESITSTINGLLESE